MADKYSFNSPPPPGNLYFGVLSSLRRRPGRSGPGKVTFCDSEQPLSRPFIRRKVIFLGFPFSESSALGATTFPSSPPTPLPPGQSEESPVHPDPPREAHGPGFSTLLSAVAPGLGLCLQAPLLPRVPLFLGGGGVWANVTGSETGVRQVGFCVPPPEVRAMCEWRRVGEERIVSEVPPTRPAPTFSRHASSAAGCALQPGVCV